MIRRFQKLDAKQVMQIWLSGNEDAHSFIAKDYWHSNFPWYRSSFYRLSKGLFPHSCGQSCFAVFLSLSVLRVLLGCHAPVPTHCVPSLRQR